jgi:hypothetical protein
MRAFAVVSLFLACAAPGWAQVPAPDPERRHDRDTIERQMEDFEWRKARDRRDLLRPLATRRFVDAVERFAPAATPAALHATWGEFLSGTGEYFVAVALSHDVDLAFHAGRGCQVFGEVRDATGRRVLGFETKSTVSVTGNQAHLEVALPLPAGAYTAVLGVALGRNDPVLMTRVLLQPAAIAPGAFEVSRLFVSGDVYPMPEPQVPDEPFAFGSIKVVPRGDRTFSSREEPWLFVVVRNPPAAAGAPQLGARVLLEGPSGPRTFAVADVTPLRLKGFENHWGLGVPLRLAGFASGDYVATLELVERGSGQALSRQAAFAVR